MSSKPAVSSASKLFAVLNNPGTATIEVGTALGDLDRLWNSSQQTQVAGKKRKNTGSAKKVKDASDGTGYGGQTNDFTTFDTICKEEEKQDEQMVKCLEILRQHFTRAVGANQLLPKLKSNKGLCALSYQLLHNDSLLDIGRRMMLYKSLLGFLLQVAKHPATLDFLAHPLYQDPEDPTSTTATCKQLLVALEAQAKVFLQLHRGKQVTPVKRYSDVEILETDESVLMANAIIDTVKAVDSFVDLTADEGNYESTSSAAAPSSSSGNGGSSSSSSSATKAAAGGVVDLTLDDDDGCIMWVSTGAAPGASANATTNTSAPASSSASSGSAAKRQKTKSVSITPVKAVTLESEEADYVKHMLPHRFAVIDMCSLMAVNSLAHYYFKTPAGTSGDPKQRMTRIAKEMATLSTTLPVEFGSSVFLRVDESRMDLIKALIIGPLGTPYANGCFEFDILLPPDYPRRPPSVNLATTGKGTVRFNPNLYNCGKVCLSLLGTWAGPGWDAQHSTLLQVLVSIQSLIMVPDPFYNEPGYANGKFQRESDAYNKNIMHQCMQFAILEQMKSPSVVFQDAIRAHFRNKRLSLKQQLQEWLLEVPQCKALVHSIDQALDQLS